MIYDKRLYHKSGIKYLCYISYQNIHESLKIQIWNTYKITNFHELNIIKIKKNISQI